MSPGWAGPHWGEPSSASSAPVPVRARASGAAANYRADGGESDDFVVLAASVAGTAHRLAGGRCEDAYAWARPQPGRLVLVVADGVSSAGKGGEGAELAVQEAASYLASSLAGGEKTAREAIWRAHEALRRGAGVVGPSQSAQLSTTLAVALLTSGAGGATAWLARVGDSAAFVLADGQWQELFDGGDDDGLQGTATDVVPFTGDARHEPGLITTATAHIPWGAAIVLMTDGMANPLRDGPSTVAPALAEVLSPGARGELAPLGLAAAADFSRRGCQDDRTVLVAWSRAT